MKNFEKVRLTRRLLMLACHRCIDNMQFDMALMWADKLGRYIDDTRFKSIENDEDEFIPEDAVYRDMIILQGNLTA